MDTEETADAWYSDETATFGDRVAAARDYIGLTEEALARRLGIRIDTLRKWENDVSEPRANKLQMLSGVLNVSLRWLLTGEGGDIGTPSDSPPREDVTNILIELRGLRSDMLRDAERLGVLEKRLRQALSEQAS